jgi:hypothetical protein
MIYAGDLTYTTPCRASTRIIAVAGGRILAQAPVSADGRWRVKTDVKADAIIGQQRHTAVAAAALTPQAPMHLTLPELVAFEFETERAATRLPAWLDPIALAGLPSDLNWSFFAQTGGLVDLHVCEFHFTPYKRRVTIPVQRGRYRLSAGTLALRPGSGEPPIQLSGVTLMTSNTHIKSQNGQVVLNVDDACSYRLHFAEAEFSSHTVTLSF